MRLSMTDEEMLIAYREAKNRRQQIDILVDRNPGTTRRDIAQWLSDHGEDVDQRLLRFGPKKAEVPEVPDQKAKADAGKPRLTLVPTQIIFDIAEVREYGCLKYKDPDNWKKVEEERYWEAAYRHFLKCVGDHKAVDPESGISHLKHLVCNLAFICDMEAGE